MRSPVEDLTILRKFLRKALPVVLGLAIVTGAAAQGEKSILEILPFTIQGIGSEEAAIIENLIHSYLSDREDIVIVLTPALEAAREAEDISQDVLSSIPVQVSPDYKLSGLIKVEENDYILALGLLKPSTGEEINLSSSHKTISGLVLKARSLVQLAISKGTEDVPEELPKNLDESDIAGRWKGDTGIEYIRLQRGGTGLAVFSSGAHMNLSYTIDNDIVTVLQSSPNTDRYYHPVPYGVAKQLVELAEPMKWEFQLFGNGTSLRGKKTATAVEYQGEMILTIHYGSARDAEWTKIR